MKITTKEATYLAGLIENKTAVSLLSNVKAEMDGAEEESLTAKGILAGGALKEDAKEVLDALAQARISARVMIQDSFAFIEKYVFKQGDKYVLAENDGGEIGIYPLVNFDDIIFELAEFIGLGQLKTVNVDLELEAAKMLALLSVMDRYRVNTLLFHGGGEELRTSYSLKEIQEGLKNPEKNGLVKVLSSHYGYKVPEEGKVEALLDDLKKEGFIDKGNGLNEDLEIFARSLLIPSSLVLVELISEDGKGEVFVDSGLGIIAGLRDIGYFLLGADVVGLRSLSGKGLLSVIEGYLRCPEI